MAKKKTSKAEKPKERTPILKQEDTPVKKLARSRVTRESYRSAESYLISFGTNPLRIPYMAKWAEKLGYTVATNEQWKEIFSKF